VLDSRPTDQGRTETQVSDEPAMGRSGASVDPDEMPVDGPIDLDTATSRALQTLPGRSPDPLVCPFLRAGVDGLQPPEIAAGGHRCVAVEPPIAVADLQRQLLCQAAVHPTCPRYVRGETAVRVSLAPGLGRRGRGAPVAIGTAAVLLVAAAAVAATGGLGPMGDRGAGASPTAGAGGAAPSNAAPSRSPLGPARTLAPVATVRPTLVATRELPAAWRHLEACPAPEACYLYVVERGDTFGAIARRFDTTVKKLRKLNPELADPSTIRVGTKVRVPPPPS
jgi:LysM domain